MKGEKTVVERSNLNDRKELKESQEMKNHQLNFKAYRYRDK